ncbi:hypothetical protein [uncultured Sphingomonas sp.]|uniref:hypothetical protein n=1 Tax=uncultured Sphingomonas sp. TaxID=158754 RepID=UPI003749148E
MTMRSAGVMMAIVAGLTAAPGAQAATPAGTRIANTAHLTLMLAGDAPLTIDSNTVSITVDPLVDAAIAAERPTVEIGAQPQPVPFVVGNPGNAATTYRIDARTDRDTVGVALIAVDADGDGRYDPARDPATTSVTLAPGANQRIFVLTTGTAADGATITATAIADAPAGTMLGTTGGRAAADVRLIAPGAAPAAQLEKAQSVASPGGGTRAVRGAIVTYTLTARFTRACAAVDLSDTVPAGTRFVPGSIALDDQPLSDAADGDAGRLDGDTVRVALGDMTAGAVRTIRFNAIIL